MSTHFSAEEIALFDERGFHPRLRVFSAVETLRLRTLLETFEQHYGSAAPAKRSDMHLTQRWAWDVVNDCRIVDPVADVLGPNVLLWSLNWFIKEPRDEKFVSYHQDATYWGLEPHDVVTAWLALSNADSRTGPMKFVVGSHRGEMRDHVNTFGELNLLSRGQEIQAEIDDQDIVSTPLHAGEMSLHHVRTIHGSEPNETDDRRIGMVMRYCATHVRQTKLRDTAVLVKGVDEHHNFDLLPRPEHDFGSLELERQRDALKRMQRAILS